MDLSKDITLKNQEGKVISGTEEVPGPASKETKPKRTRKKKTEPKEEPVIHELKKVEIMKLRKEEYFDGEMRSSLIKRAENKALYLRQDGVYQVLSVGIVDDFEIALKMWTTPSMDRAKEKYNKL